MKYTIGMIGVGNMGQAISERIKSKYEVWVFDKDSNKLKSLSGIKIASDNIDLVKKVDAVILAVKPQDFDSVLEEIKHYAANKLIISIAAGVTTDYIEKCLGKVRVIRVMPNLPAKIGEGMICLCKGSFADKDELNFTKDLFDYLGKTLIVEEERMNAVTAISGSGPGFLCDMVDGKSIEETKKYSEDFFIPTLEAVAIKLGFTPEQANLLAATTGAGLTNFLVKAKLSPSEVKKQVASKGGTTEAGLEVLHKGGTLEEAVQAAIKRAKELSRG